MMTWWCVKDGTAYLATAENVAMARAWLKREHNIDVSSGDLFVVKTSSRWTKKLVAKGEE